MAAYCNSHRCSQRGRKGWTC